MRKERIRKLAKKVRSERYLYKSTFVTPGEELIPHHLVLSSLQKTLE